MKRITALLIMIMFCPWTNAQEISGIPEAVIIAIREADANDLAEYFNSTVELNLPGQQNTCSASQGEMIMKDFFKKSPPDTFTVIRQGNTDNTSMFSICDYYSGKLHYQVYLYMKKVDDEYLIHKLNFEEQK